MKNRPVTRINYPADYYTTACECGANPAGHVGHTQACADAHRQVLTHTNAVAISRLLHRNGFTMSPWGPRREGVYAARGANKGTAIVSVNIYTPSRRDGLVELIGTILTDAGYVYDLSLPGYFNIQGRKPAEATL